MLQKLRTYSDLVSSRWHCKRCVIKQHMPLLGEQASFRKSSIQELNAASEALSVNAYRVWPEFLAADHHQVKRRKLDVPPIDQGPKSCRSSSQGISLNSSATCLPTSQLSPSETQTCHIICGTPRDSEMMPKTTCVPGNVCAVFKDTNLKIVPRQMGNITDWGGTVFANSQGEPENTDKLTTSQIQHQQTADVEEPKGIPSNGVPRSSSQQYASGEHALSSDESINKAFGDAADQLVAKAISDEGLLSLMRVVATGEASPAEASRFQNYVTSLNSIKQVSEETALGKSKVAPQPGPRNQQLSTQGTGWHNRQTRLQHNHVKILGDIDRQTKELSSPYGPSLASSCGPETHSWSDAAVSVNLNISSTPVEQSTVFDSSPEHRDLRNTVESEVYEMVDSKINSTLGTCTSCAKKVFDGSADKEEIIIW